MKSADFCRIAFATGLLAAACGGSETFIAEEDFEESDVTVATGPLSWRDVEVELPESLHPYANGTSQSWDVAGPDCARQLRLTFEFVEVESRYDFVTMSRADGRQVASYTGNRGRFTRTVPGSAATIRLTSDRSITGRGFRITRVEAQTPCSAGFHCAFEDSGREVCQSDLGRCARVRCAAGFECTEEGPNACIPSCNGFSCGPDETCFMNVVQCIRAPCPAQPECRPNPTPTGCTTVRCSATTHCEVDDQGNGGCVPNDNPCAVVRCASGTSCQVIDGGAQCVPILTCASVLCAPGTFCEDDQPGGPVCTERPFQVETTDFGSSNPYRNNQSQSWQVTSDVVNAVQIRLSFSRFDLEDGYDFVVLTAPDGRELARYTGNRGAFTTEIFDGASVRVSFTTDSSVTRSGFRVDRVESR